MFIENKYRKTLERKAKVKGIGLHSGRSANLVLHPAASGSGIVFKHPGFKSTITADINSVIDTSYAVTLGNADWRVQTVEHLMAALTVCGITDVVCEIDSMEVPILDGSARPFLEAIREAGVKEYSDPVEAMQVHNPIWVMDGDRYIICLPSDELKISYTIDFRHPKIKSQTLTVSLDAELFEREILGARTFGFMDQVANLQSQGLALGGGEQNAIIFTEDGILNPDLRYEDECIRHKILDLVGDLSLLGRPVCGHFIAAKAGHTLDVAMAKKLVLTSESNELARPSVPVGGGTWQQVEQVAH